MFDSALACGLVTAWELTEPREPEPAPPGFDAERLVGTPSPETIAALFLAEPGDLSSADATAGAIACELGRRLLDGLQLRFLAQAAKRRRVDGELSEVGQELSAATNLNPITAGLRADLACTVLARLPLTLELLEAGTLTLRHAEIIERATRELTDDEAREVDQAVPPGPAGLNRRLAEAVARVRPRTPDEIAEKAKRGREVLFWSDSIAGTGGIEIVGPIADVAQIKAALDSAARAQHPGDDRKLGARRFDVVYDWARRQLGLSPADRRTPAVSSCQTCGRTGPATVPINVTISFEALLRLSEAPGDLDGHPIPASVARELAADGRWRRWTVEAATGRLLDVGAATYRPGAELARYVRGRNRSCAFPSCNRPAARCDLDHTRAYRTAGGLTTSANLTPLCRMHHRVKHETPWSYRRTASGQVLWTAPSGRTYTKEPDTYADDAQLSAYLTAMSERRQARGKPPPTPAPNRDDPDEEPPF